MVGIIKIITLTCIKKYFLLIYFMCGSLYSIYIQTCCSSTSFLMKIFQEKKYAINILFLIAKWLSWQQMPFCFAIVSENVKTCMVIVAKLN